MDHDAEQHRDYVRQEAVRQAIDAADRIILDVSDGTVEMTNRLTAEVSCLLHHLSIAPFLDSQPKMFASGASYKATGAVLSTLELEWQERSDVGRKALLSRVALAFAEKINGIHSSGLLRQDMESPATSK